MAMTDLEVVLNGWAAAWSSHDPGNVLALFTDDCVYEDVPFGLVLRGKDALRAFAIGAFAAVPDFTFELTTHFGAGHVGGMEWLMSGSHEGDLPGIPATGNRFSAIRGATVVELHGSKIRRNSDYWDAATLMKQVGLLR
jgi:steroid delta-isomerase-like uncharacterized protein